MNGGSGSVYYTWDDNGNLLYDGQYSYTYNHANRLAALSGGGLTLSYAYNGMGDRLQQTVNGETTSYHLDTSTSLSAGLASGLTQVLDDGEYTYLYGVNRIAQADADDNFAYFHGDALGSVRQLVDEAGEVTLAQGYTPYGDQLFSSGIGDTSYAFTGELRDSYIKYL